MVVHVIGQIYKVDILFINQLDDITAIYDVFLTFLGIYEDAVWVSARVLFGLWSSYQR